MDDWKPIETAPDATVLAIWLWDESDPERGSMSHDVVTNDGGEWTDSYGDPVDPPSHWMPLPAPPNRQGI